MRSFSLDDVMELYGQYTEETGQPFLPAVVKDAFTLSQGHPGLVNALAAEIVGSLVIDQDRAEVIGPDQVERARIVVQRYPEYLEPLRKALSTSRFRQLCKAVLDEQVIAPDSLEELWLTLYHGWVIAGRSGLKIANPMFRDIIRDVLAWDADKLMSQAGASMPDTMIAMETARDGILSRPLLP
jgi:hypothetical protein